MEASAAAERPRWHLGHLDALRGIAVLGVLWVHCTDGCRLSHFWSQAALNGQRGVQLFFLVSAFTLFLSNENRRRAELHPSRNFFLRRFFRITPMYYAVTLLTALVLPGLYGGWRDGLLGLLLAQGVSPVAILHVAPGAWTLTDEAMFYLCLPLLMRLIRSLRGALVTLALATPVVLGVSFALARHRPDLYQYFSFLWFPIEFPVFLMGIVIYFFWKEWIATDRLFFRFSHRALSLWFLAGFAALVACNFPETNRKLYPSSAAWALLVVAVLIHPWPLLVNRVTILLGKISFSLYLLHIFALIPISDAAARLPWLVAHPVLQFLGQFLLTLTITAAAATLTWLYLEETGIRLGRRLIGRLEHRAERRHATRIPIPASALLDESNTRDAQF